MRRMLGALESMREKRWERAKALSGWAVAIILLISLVSVVQALNPSFGTIIQPGSMAITDDFVIFKDVTNSVFARNGNTGSIDYSGSDLGAVVNSAVTALYAYPDGGSVHIRAGNYTYTTTISIGNTKPISLIGDGLATVSLHYAGNGWALL